MSVSFVRITDSDPCEWVTEPAVDSIRSRRPPPSRHRRKLTVPPPRRSPLREGLARRCQRRRRHRRGCGLGAVSSAARPSTRAVNGRQRARASRIDRGHGKGPQPKPAARVERPGARRRIETRAAAPDPDKDPGPRCRQGPRRPAGGPRRTQGHRAPEACTGSSSTRPIRGPAHTLPGPGARNLPRVALGIGGRTPGQGRLSRLRLEVTWRCSLRVEHMCRGRRHVDLYTRLLCTTFTTGPVLRVDRRDLVRARGARASESSGAPAVTVGASSIRVLVLVTDMASRRPALAAPRRGPRAAASGVTNHVE